MQTQDSFLAKTINPFYQAGIALVGVVAITLLAKVVGLSGIVSIPVRFPWMSAASFMLLFALFNSLYSLRTDDMMRYWGRSLYSFMGLAGLAGLSAWFFSGLTIGAAGSYRWIYIVVTIGYFVFLSMMATLRKIVDFAQKEEWNNPRIRRK